MPLKARAKAIDQFQKDPPTTVFLLSMRSGAVGSASEWEEPSPHAAWPPLCLTPSLPAVNLTAATHVFLMEPVFNPALEAQAIGRSWRSAQPYWGWRGERPSPWA